jgi:signal transduction histidine kinase
MERWQARWQAQWRSGAAYAHAALRALCDRRWWSSFVARSPLLRTRGLALAAGLALLLVLLNAMVALQSLQTVRDREQRVAHTHAVLAKLDAVYADTTSIAAATRGYVISGNDAFLQTYTVARASLVSELTQLTSLTRDDAQQQQRIAALKPVIASRLNDFQRAIDLQQHGQRDQALQQSVTFDLDFPSAAIQTRIQQMQATEQDLLNSRAAQAVAATHQATVAVIIAALVDIVLLALVFVLVRQWLAFRERTAREQAKAEAQAQVRALETINQRLNEFLGIAGHELRTPLTSLGLNVQLTRRLLARSAGGAAASPREVGDSSQLAHRLDMMERQVNRQNRLIGDMLDASRLNAGKLDLRREPADLCTVVHDCVEEQHILSPARTITLALPLGGDSIPAVIDADRVSQVVMNFLSNALKYSAAETAVQVSVGREESYARVSVTDEGPGLTPDQQAQVWDRFYRAEGIKVRGDSSIGLGLGLYISREIIERHHGQVGIESTPGQGSTFWFTLPLDRASSI